MDCLPFEIHSCLKIKKIFKKANGKTNGCAIKKGTLCRIQYHVCTFTNHESRFYSQESFGSCHDVLEKAHVHETVHHIRESNHGFVGVNIGFPANKLACIFCN